MGGIVGDDVLSERLSPGSLRSEKSSQEFGVLRTSLHVHFSLAAATAGKVERSTELTGSLLSEIVGVREVISTEPLSICHSSGSSGKNGSTTKLLPLLASSSSLLSQPLVMSLCLGSVSLQKNR